MPADKYLQKNFTDNPLDASLDRRDFLKVTGGGIFILFALWDAETFAQERGRIPTDFNAFLRIGEDGRVTCYTGKIEMGQGIITSLAMEMADELDVPLDRVDMVMGDTDLCPWDRGTFGSLSTRSFGPHLRAAAAEGRRVLLELASESLHVPVENLVTENGTVYDRRNKNKHVTYAQLTQGKRIERHIGAEVQVKQPPEFKVMHTSVTRRDAEEKVTGQAKFAADIRLPGMLYAKVVRPPSHAATLKSIDTSGAEQVPGARVIRDGDLVAVLHKYPDVAEQARAKIKTSYDVPKSDLNENTIFDHLLGVASDGDVVTQGGDLQAGASEATSTVESTYLDGYVAHSPMEPHAAIVQVVDGKATVWASTQNPFSVQGEVARALNVPMENVRVITPFVGGGFGGKTTNLQVVDAARLAKASGKPVQVAYTRAEEFFYDSFRPAAVVKIRSGITKQNRISFWDYHVYFAGERGSQQFYSIPNHRTMSSGSGWGGTPGSHPFATGAWRAPANNTNTFARESHMDMLAAKAGVDPVEFRLRHLDDPKMIGVLRRVAKEINWKPAASPSGRGYGVACGIDAGTDVAMIAEVAVDKQTGKVQVKRVVCAQDMGLCVNPEGATIQMEGCITMGMGYALSEDVHFTGGEITDLNFDTYELPKFSWLPKIETYILEKVDEAPQGGGEPAIITMGAAIANAIYDAVGARVFQLPMTPERVKQALSKA